jgi:hypothetical protein
MRKTKNNSRIIRSGPFEGKKIEFAPTTGIDKFRAISEDFMNKIFGFKPGEYLISDESSLYDFTGLQQRELGDIDKKIQETYNIDVSDIKSRNLLEIFKRIRDSKSGASC